MRYGLIAENPLEPLRPRKPIRLLSGQAVALQVAKRVA